MRCLIVLNGMEGRTLTDEEKRFYRGLAERSDTVICADGGLNLAASLGIEPDMVIGDMDSADPEILKRLPAEKIRRYPPEKDLTDGRLALNHALEIGCDEITLTSALSDRMDHSLANIQMLLSVPEGVRAAISEPDVEVMAVKGPASVSLAGKRGERVSILPLSERVKGIELRGLKYELKNGEFAVGGMNGISNEMVGGRAEIKVEEGIIAIFHYVLGSKSK